MSRSHHAVGAIAALRLSLGVGALLAPARTARLFGFPDSQQTPMARLIGRWFGVREIVLATLALRGHGGPTPLRPDSPAGPVDDRQRDFARLNAVNDLVDAAAMVVPLARRQGIDRAQIVGIPVALGVSAGWVEVLRGRAASASADVSDA
jgi:hypothetical protein